MTVAYGIVVMILALGIKVIITSPLLSDLYVLDTKVLCSDSALHIHFNVDLMCSCERLESLWSLRASSPPQSFQVFVDIQFKLHHYDFVSRAFRRVFHRIPRTYFSAEAAGERRKKVPLFTACLLLLPQICLKGATGKAQVTSLHGCPRLIPRLVPLIPIPA